MQPAPHTGVFSPDSMFWLFIKRLTRVWKEVT